MSATEQKPTVLKLFPQVSMAQTRVVSLCLFSNLWFVNSTSAVLHSGYQDVADTTAALSYLDFVGSVLETVTCAT